MAPGKCVSAGSRSQVPSSARRDSPGARAAGPPVAPTHKGFGSLLIETSFEDVGRPCVEFRPEGVECFLEFAL
jgi:two-component sensor histidine kinase